MITRRHLLGSLAIAPLAATPAFANGPVIFADRGVAIRGYDPVAYFDEATPVQGNDLYQLMWRNAIWRFASLRNMGLFERDPHGFAPQYGGYCAMSMTQGNISETQPDAWVVHDGKLYLVHSVVARDRWQQNPDVFIAKADSHWPTALCS